MNARYSLLSRYDHGTGSAPRFSGPGPEITLAPARPVSWLPLAAPVPAEAATAAAASPEGSQVMTTETPSPCGNGAHLEDAHWQAAAACTECGGAADTCPWPGYCGVEALPLDDLCEMDGEDQDSHGAERYWHCGRSGAVTVDGMRLCLEHAGECGHGPLQAEYGFDPDDGLNPDQATPVPAQEDQ